MPKRTPSPPARKKAYAAPRLVRYGAVHALTNAGSAGGLETGMGMMTPMPSCRGVKENIARIGTHPLGVGLYLFDYKPEFRDRFGHGRQFGVMADEVEAVFPAAVALRPDGIKVVDYAMLGMGKARR